MRRTVKNDRSIALLLADEKGLITHKSNLFDPNNFTEEVTDRMDLSRVADEKYIHLTTEGRNTGKPHTVELWFAVAGDKIYLSHEGAYTDYMKNILKNNQVQFKIAKTQFKGKARIAKRGDAFETGKHALYLKYYGKATEDKIDDWFSESTVIEISAISTI